MNSLSAIQRTKKPRVQIHGKGHSSNPEEFEGRENSFQGTKPNNDPSKPAESKWAQHFSGVAVCISKDSFHVMPYYWLLAMDDEKPMKYAEIWSFER